MAHLTSELPSIKRRCWPNRGDRDPRSVPEVMRRKIRGSKLIVLSPASHFANRDQPEAWNRAALDFLAGTDGRRSR